MWHLFRWCLAIVVFFACWVGMSQLGVAMLGHEDNGIILFGMLGMWMGVYLGMSIGLRRNIITLRPLE